NGGFVTLNVTVLPAAYLIFLELALLVAVALMFSSFTTPMLSALYSFAVYAIGHFSSDLQLAADLSGSPVVRAMLRTAYYLLPNLSNFSYIAQASHGRMVPAEMAMKSTIYAIVYIGILLSAAVLIFQRRNFK
ncbi:MAG TPA: ABC transporter permease, partial [Blastocatellia bacterium]|nr:ABC transporter permease [Blastocatellia bacterium]